MVLVNLAVKVAGIAQHSAVFHHLHMRFGDNVLTARNSDEDITILSSLLHRHHTEAVKYCLHALDRIHLGNNDVGTHALGTHSHALAAPAVACNDNGSASNGHIGGADDAVKRGLAGAITVIKKILAISIVNSDHWERQMTRSGQRLEAVHTRGGLLAAAHQVGDQILALAVQHIHQITTVVNNQLRRAFERLTQIHVIFLARAGVGSKNSNAAIYQRSCNLVLSGQRIAACYHYVGAGVLQHQCQVSSFCLQMNGDNHIDAAERLGFAVLLIQVI